MKIEFLKEALSLAQSKNFQESADEQFLSQAGLSRHIKAVEAALGVELFNRSSRTIKLTEAGALVLPYMQRLSDLYDDMLVEIDNLHDQPKKSLNVAYTSTLRKTGFLDVINHFFTSEITEGKVNFISEESQNTVKQILQGKIDCGCATGNELVDNPRLGSVHLSSDYLVAIVPDKPQYKDLDHIALEALQEEKLIIYRADSSIAKSFFSKAEAQGITPSVALYTTVGSDVNKLVNSGFGVGIHTSYSARRNTTPEMRIRSIKIEPEIVMDYYFVYNAKGNKEALRRLVEFVKRQYAQ